MNKHLPLLALLFFCFTSQFVVAQKDAPVAGDAAKLVDLLKKDYNSLDPATRGEELIRDRALVLATFKSYLSVTKKDELKKKLDSTDRQEFDTKLKKYNEAKQAYETFNNTNFSISNGSVELLKKLDTTTAKLSEEIEKARKDYFTEKIKLDTTELSSIGAVYKGSNLYLAHMARLFVEKYGQIEKNAADAFAAPNYASSIQKSISFLGGDLAFETIIEGLSRFLAKRIKEELTTYAINEVQEWLKNPSEESPLNELKVLLPITTKYLLSFQADQVTNFTSEIKQYIEDDLNHLLENAADLKGTPRFKSLIEQHPDVDFAFEALELIPNLSKLKRPIDYFKIIESSRNINRWRSDVSKTTKFNLANTLHLASMLAHSMTIIENGQPRFAGSDFLGSYASEYEFFVLYFGFLRQQNLKYYNVEFSLNKKFSVKAKEKMEFTLPKNAIYKKDKETPDTVSADNTVVGIAANSTLSVLSPPVQFESAFARIMDKAKPGNIEALKAHKRFFESVLTQVGKNAEKVFTAAQEIKKANKSGNKIGADTVHTFVNSAIDLSKEVVFSADTLLRYFAPFVNSDANDKQQTLTFELNRDLLNLQDLTKPYFEVATTANDVLLDLKNKKYATGLLKALEMTRNFLPVSTSEDLSDLSETIRTIAAIEENGQLKNWKRAVKALAKEEIEELRYEGNLAKAAKAIDTELGKIKLFYRQEFEDTSALGDIKVLQKVLRTIYLDKNFDSNSPNTRKAKDLIKNNDKFKTLLISYYSRKNLEVWSKSIFLRMGRIKISKDNKEISVFDPDDIAAIETVYNNYLNAAYDYLINNKNKNDKAFTLAQRQLKALVQGYFAALPQKLDMITDPRVVKLIHFLNDMALAEDAEDVEKAIEAFALPSGSFAIKRKAKWNLSINSYPGLLPAFERSKRLDLENNEMKTSWSTTLGFTAPVGISCTWGLKKGSSLGVYVPVFDIGALTRIHLDSDTTTTVLPKFNFKNILSPGFYAHYGFRNSPFSIHAGIQYGPELRQITPGENGEENTDLYDSYRIGLGIVLDIPLLNIHTKPRFEYP
ncbi:MAG: hypothetical protein AAFZ15_09380 [Bacteroidota bacterium]